LYFAYNQVMAWEHVSPGSRRSSQLHILRSDFMKYFLRLLTTLR